MRLGLYRQGDVLFRKIGAIPGNTQKRENGIVAYGEVTGHAHRLADQESAEVVVTERERVYVRVSDKGIALGGATFIHEEHPPITLPAGNYEVIIQQEYTPAGIRSVMD